MGHDPAPAPRRRLVARCATLAPLAALVLAVTGCAAEAPDGSTGTGRSSHGPLSATTQVGGNAVRAPRATPWRVSFGNFVLCSRAHGTDIVVEDVRHHDAVAPEHVEVFVRSVDPDEFSGRHIPTRLQPFYSVLGAPPRFGEPYAGTAPAGAFSPWRPGLRVTQSCPESGQRVHGYTELVFTVQVSRRGAQLEGFTVDYRADGEPYTLHVPWVMIGCGSAINNPEACT